MPGRLPPCWIALTPGVLESGAGQGASAAVIDALAHAVQAAVSGGLRGVLLREPSLSDGCFLDLARVLRELLHAPEVGGWLGVHDRLHLVEAAEADGGHVGGRSLPLHAGRRVLGSDRTLGVSTHASDTAGAGGESPWSGADLALHAPVFAPISKSAKGGDPLGPSGLRSFVERCPLPVWALGGVTVERLADLTGSGAAGACTIGALWQTTGAPVTSSSGPLGDVAGIEARARALSAAVEITFEEVAGA